MIKCSNLLILKFVFKFQSAYSAMNHIKRFQDYWSRVRPNIKYSKYKKVSLKTFSRKPWVGPPHPVSNLRPTVFPQWSDSTQAERVYYKAHQEVQQWNQEFWETHNEDFEKAKEAYIKRCQMEKKKKSITNEPINAEDVSLFYKSFLDANLHKHINYNWNWYRKNCFLLWLSAKAFCSRQKKKIVDSTSLKTQD